MKSRFHEENIMIGVMISEEEYKEYQCLKKKNTPMNKIKGLYHKHCPVCNYVVDNIVPTQNYCDSCGQKFNR